MFEALNSATRKINIDDILHQIFLQEIAYPMCGKKLCNVHIMLIIYLSKLDMYKQT